MSTTSVSNNTSYFITPTSTDASSTSSTSSTGSSEINFQSFLELLTAELQYQDPQDPVSSTEYVSQMASFSSLSQLESITNSVDASQAYDLIGKSVTYQTTDATGAATYETGTVDSVTLKNNVPYLNIGSLQVELSSVTTVASSTTTASSTATSV